MLNLASTHAHAASDGTHAFTFLARRLRPALKGTPSPRRRSPRRQAWRTCRTTWALLDAAPRRHGRHRHLRRGPDSRPPATHDQGPRLRPHRDTDAVAITPNASAKFGEARPKQEQPWAPSVAKRLSRRRQPAHPARGPQLQQD